MESLNVQSFLLGCLLLNGVLAQQQPAYRPESTQKVQLEDIEQDNLKSIQQATGQVQSVPQYTSQYPGQNSQIVYSVPTQQPQHITPAQAGTPQTASYPLFAIPAQNTAGLPGQQQYVYYMQAPQQVYDAPYFGSPYTFVPQSAQPVLPSNVNVNDLYRTLQPGQTVSAPTKNSASVKTAAAPQIPANYYFSALPQPYFSAVHLPQNLPVPSNTPQYVAYNSFYPVQTAQKSIYSSGVKSTTASPSKTQTEAGYRFEYNSPDFAKLRVTG